MKKLIKKLKYWYLNVKLKFAEDQYLYIKIKFLRCEIDSSAYLEQRFKKKREIDNLKKQIQQMNYEL